MDSDNNRLVSGALPKEEWCVCACLSIFYMCVFVCVHVTRGVCVKGGLMTTFMAMKSIFRDC